MAELIGAAPGIADVAFRVVSYLKDVKDATETIERDKATPIQQIEALKDAHDELRRGRNRSLNEDVLQEEERSMWSKHENVLLNGHDLVDEIQACVKNIYREDRRVGGRWNALKKQHRKRERQVRLSAQRDHIHFYQQSLQSWLLFVNRQTARGHHASNANNLAELTALVGSLEKAFKEIRDTSAFPSHALSSLLALQQVLNDAGSSLALRRSQTIGNKYLDIPQ